MKNDSKKTLRFTGEDASSLWDELRNGFLMYMQHQEKTLEWVKSHGEEEGYTKKGVKDSIKTFEHFMKLDKEILDKLNYIVWDGVIGKK